jgi:beta-lactam-binding protein with PASTA domain
MVDALAAAPLAARYGAPIFLADRATVPALANAATRSKTVNAKIIALGGTGAVSSAILAAFAGGADTPLIIYNSNTLIINEEMTPEQLALQPEYTSADIEAYNLAIATPEDTLTDARQAQVDAKINEVIARYITPDMSDLDKERAIHDYLIINSIYEWSTPAGREPSNQDYVYSPYGLLVKGRGNCAAYARTMKIFMDRLGIPCDYVVISARPEDCGRHAINRIQIGGVWYLLDVTWDEPDSIGALEVSADKAYRPEDVETYWRSATDSAYTVKYKYFNRDLGNFGHSDYVMKSDDLLICETDMPREKIYAAKTMSDYAPVQPPDYMNISAERDVLRNADIGTWRAELVNLGLRSDLLAAYNEEDRHMYQGAETLMRLRSICGPLNFEYAYDTVSNPARPPGSLIGLVHGNYSNIGERSYDYGNAFLLPKPLTVRISLGARPISLPDFSSYTYESWSAEYSSNNSTFANIYFEVAYEYDENIPQGRLISQSPAPGTQSGQVKLVFSKGSVNEIILPGGDTNGDNESASGVDNSDTSSSESTTGGGFIGLTMEEAAAIKDPTLSLSWNAGQYDDYSDTIPEGRIVWQSIPPGTAVPRYTTVTIGLSLGPMPMMPDLIGMSKEEAWNAYFNAGFLYIKAPVDPQYSDDVPFGYLLTQFPEAGTRCDPRQTKAEFIYSMGPAPER